LTEASGPAIKLEAMDQFSAHLDRGWDLIQRGDAVGAEASARRALELDGESPEAFNLLGFVAALRGEYEEAREHYRQAIALDDTYLEAILNAAELHIHPLPDFDEAERLCDDALYLVETDEERVDALLLKFDALLGQGRSEAARELCRRFPPPPYNNPAHAFLVGRAHYEVGDKKNAIPLIEEATRLTPESAEAFYYLGLVRDEQGDEQSSTRAFLRSRELDLDAPVSSWSLSSTAFFDAVLASLESLEPELARWVDPADVYVTTLPGAEVVVDGVDPRALLMIDALTDRGPNDPVEGDDPGRLRLFVYQRNIERIAGSVEQLVSELRSALEAEMSAYVGRDTASDPPPSQAH
jgi:Flp pilus assembly protein TadD